MTDTTLPTPPPSQPPDAPPDWSTLSRDVTCPLCAYNLRGLLHPRCPECGYAFSWRDILDAQRRPHPYLFEHHPERPMRSFARTLLNGLLPRRFWRTLSPLHSVRPARLSAYWLLILLLASPLIAVPAGIMTRLSWQNASTLRTSMARIFATPANPDLITSIVRDYGSVQAYLDQYYPAPTLLPALRRALLSVDDSLFTFVAFAAWPLLTLLVLTLYRRSTRQAKVRFVHVLRCTVYSADFVAWLGLFILALYLVPQAVAPIGITPQVPYREVLWLLTGEYPLVSWLAVVVLATYRLTVAYSTYLRMSRAWLAIPLAQVIVLLVYLQAYVILLGVPPG